MEGETLEKSFAIGEALRYGWDLTIAKIDKVLLLIVVHVGLSVAFYLVNAALRLLLLPEGPATEFAAMGIHTVLNSWLGAAIMLGYLRLVRVGTVPFNFLAASLRFTPSFLITNLIIGAANLLSLIPTIIALVVLYFSIGPPVEVFGTIDTPGTPLPELVESHGYWMIASLIIIGFGIIPLFYVYTMLMFAPAMVVDREIGSLEALRDSVRITEGIRLHLISFQVAMTLVVVAGFLALFIGLFIAIPIVTIAMLWVYMQLLEQSGIQVEQIPPGRGGSSMNLKSFTLTLMVAIAMLAPAAFAEDSGDGKETMKVLRHVVLFNYKEDVTDEQKTEVLERFAALEEKIDEVIDFEGGPNVEAEGLGDGFEHVFTVTFADEDGRAAYLPHEAHQDFVSFVGPLLEKVTVADYWAETN